MIPIWLRKDCSDLTHKNGFRCIGSFGSVRSSFRWVSCVDMSENGGVVDNVALWLLRSAPSSAPVRSPSVWTTAADGAPARRVQWRIGAAWRGSRTGEAPCRWRWTGPCSGSEDRPSSRRVFCCCSWRWWWWWWWWTNSRRQVTNGHCQCLWLHTLTFRHNY